MKTQVIRSIRDLRKWRASQSKSIGFVPTMGALHEGHATLLRKARSLCDQLVLSVFVNPMQFGKNEDLNTYPKTFEEDLRIAEQERVDVLFFPSALEMYPKEFSTTVTENTVSAPLCGRFRPGHFAGVCTVVLKLWNLVEPHFSLFGLKDAQQFFVLRKLAQDLALSHQVWGVSTVRESDGLAMSSRNRYLSPEQREKAPLLYRTLRDASDQVLKGASFTEVQKTGFEKLTQAGFEVQYLECLNLPDFSPLIKIEAKPALIAAAVFLGKTRLIDNCIVQDALLKEWGFQVI